VKEVKKCVNETSNNSFEYVGYFEKLVLLYFARRLNYMISIISINGRNENKLNVKSLNKPLYNVSSSKFLCHDSFSLVK